LSVPSTLSLYIFLPISLSAALTSGELFPSVSYDVLWPCSALSLCSGTPRLLAVSVRPLGLGGIVPQTEHFSVHLRIFTSAPLFSFSSVITAITISRGEGGKGGREGEEERKKRLRDAQGEGAILAESTPPSHK
ncbi:unnamed protein product, partial [Pleuronectes platessa]